MKRLRLPKSVKVGGVDYEVVRSNSNEDNLKYIGLHSGERSRLKISNYSRGIKLADQKILEIFLHECMHALDSVFLGMELKEHTVGKLSYAWFQVLSDNDLKIHDIKYPKKVRYGGFTYDIEINYLVDDTLNEEGPYITNSISNVIKLGIVDNYSHDYLKVCFIESIMHCILNKVVFTEKEIKSVNVYSFSNGLYQLFKDNKIDLLIREWGK